MRIKHVLLVLGLICLMGVEDSGDCGDPEVPRHIKCWNGSEVIVDAVVDSVDWLNYSNGYRYKTRKGRVTITAAVPCVISPADVAENPAK